MPGAALATYVLFSLLRPPAMVALLTLDLQIMPLLQSVLAMSNYGYNVEHALFSICSLFIAP